MRICAELGEREELRKIVEARIEPTDVNLESGYAFYDWTMRKVQTSHHISGNCAMGPASDPVAVVDQQGRIHGIQGLRVADASIMPDCVRANINATTMAIGERIADFVR